MRIVLDTNILLVSVSDKSESYWLFDAFKKRKFELAFTTEILAEYEEQFSWHWSAGMASVVTASILELPNAIATTVYYRLNLISHDKDDNKFVDCAFASNADFIITEDGHFTILKTVSFPSIRAITLHEFKQIVIAEKLI